MRAAAGFLLLLLTPAAPQPQYFRYQRPVEGLPAAGGQTCLVLDGLTYAHASAGLADLRLYSNGAEVAYALRTDAQGQGAQDQGTQETFEPLNKGLRDGHTNFDIALDGRRYDDVELEMTVHDFIATVEVSGSESADGTHPTKLGSFTTFDLSRQKLGRSTVLHLPRSNFQHLHFRIDGPIQPEQVTAVAAGHKPAVEPTYVAVAQTAQVQRKGHATVAEFTVPAHVPVERVVVDPGPDPAQFSRPVTVEVAPIQQAADHSAPAPVRASAGTLLRVHSLQNGRRIDEDELAIEPLFVDFDRPSKWTISIDNGDDAPLAVRSVRLEMLERRLCFEAAAGAVYTLRYGDAALEAPRYDYAQLFAERPDAARARIGTERNNPAWQPRPDERPFTEKHPALLWLALLAVVVLLGWTALRSRPGPGQVG
jgi:hypothetical protein